MKTFTLLCLIVVGGCIAFFQIFHPQTHCIMILSFYQNVKLGPSITFYYQPPIPPPPPAHPLSLAPQNRKILRQDRNLLKEQFNALKNTIQCSLSFSNESTCYEITQFYF